MSDELPEGWSERLLGECFLDIRNGTTEPQNKEGRGLPVTRIESIQRARLEPARFGYINDAPPTLVDTFSYQVGDILFSHINSVEHVGKTALYEGTPRVLLHGMNLLRLRLGHDTIHPHFAYLFMQSKAFRDGVVERVTHAVNQVSINQKNLATIPLRIAPLAEQRRIVEKVEALLEQVNRAKERLDRVPLLLKRFRQSVLAAACAGELTQEWRLGRLFGVASALALDDGLPPLPAFPEEWSVVPLEQVVRRFQYGTSDKADADERTGIPVLRMGNIQDGKLDLSDLKYIGREAAQGFLVEPGDVLFNRTNSPELVGKTAVVDSDKSMAFASYLIRAKIKKDLIRPTFVSWWINSAWGRSWARQVRTDGVSQSNINSTKLAAMPLPLPSVEEQDEALRIGSSLLNLSDVIERRLQAATARANKLPQSILSKAFSGELVPTEAELARQEGRAYETAEELLKRVTCENAGAPAVGRGRGRRKAG